MFMKSTYTTKINNIDLTKQNVKEFYNFICELVNEYLHY